MVEKVRSPWFVLDCFSLFFFFPLFFSLSSSSSSFLIFIIVSALGSGSRMDHVIG